MEVRTCKRCQRNFLWDSGPVEWINSCPRCSGQTPLKDVFAEWVFKGCCVIGAILAAWALVGAVKFFLGVQ